MLKRLLPVVLLLCVAALWSRQDPGGYDWRLLSIDGITLTTPLEQVQSFVDKRGPENPPPLHPRAMNYLYKDRRGAFFKGCQLLDGSKVLLEAGDCRLSHVVRVLGPGEESRAFRNELLYRERRPGGTNVALIVAFDHNEDFTTNYTVTGFEFFWGPEFEDL